MHLEFTESQGEGGVHPRKRRLTLMIWPADFSGLSLGW